MSRRTRLAAQLDDLGAARPYALWVRGSADLRASCEKSLAVVGARAATAHGEHAATTITADLASQGWAIISGGAHGIDAAAHGGRSGRGRPTIAVLPCGPDVAYPRAHCGLLADIAACGAVVSEYPPGRPPSRMRTWPATASSPHWPVAPSWSRPRSAAAP
jgi:DNA processing protein